MPRTISSAWTFPIKYVFPLLWIGGVGYALSLRMQPEAVASASAPGIRPPGPPWAFFAVWLLCFTVVLWTVARLKRVRLESGALLVSNYLREIRVPLTQVMRITQNRWLNGQPITIRFRVETPFGTRITFLPPSRFRLALWQEDPLVGELRALAGLSARAS